MKMKKTMNNYKGAVDYAKEWDRIFRKLVKVDEKAQREIRKTWLANGLYSIDFDDFSASEQ